jgi:pimeloyl-ACP methyl ester carboxylesterase
MSSQRDGTSRVVQRSRILAVLGLVVAAGAIAMASPLLRRAATGRVAFRIWRILSPEAHRGGYAAVNGVRIYYETYGEGPPVLVLHGGLGSLVDMCHQIRALADKRFVLAPDSRGQGRSTDADAPLSYGLMADDMVRLLDVLHLGAVDVVGWSDGGIIGLDLAMRYPERVRHLVAIGANFDPTGLKELPPATVEVPPPPRAYLRDAPDPGHWPTIYRKVMTMWRTEPHDTPGQLGQIKAPTLIIAGEFDAIRSEHTNQLARAIPGAMEEIVPGGTHFVLSEQSDVVNALILRFLNAPSA